jgi:hypothetical protein
MNSFKVMICVLCFFLDVHVRADEVCWGKTVPCAVEAAHGRRDLQASGLSLSLDRGALLEQRDGDVLQLVRGSFYVESSTTVSLRTPFGAFSCAGEKCTALFQRDDEKVVVMNLGGEWRVRRAGDPEIYRIPPATSLRLSAVGVNGRAAMDFPQSLAWLPTLKLWGRLYPGTKPAFTTAVEAFRPVWRAAVEKTSREDEQVAARDIASHDEAVARRQATLKAREREDAELRRQFRARNYLSE